MGAIINIVIVNWRSGSFNIDIPNAIKTAANKNIGAAIANNIEAKKNHILATNKIGEAAISPNAISIKNGIASANCSLTSKTASAGIIDITIMPSVIPIAPIRNGKAAYPSIKPAAAKPGAASKSPAANSGKFLPKVFILLRCFTIIPMPKPSAISATPKISAAGAKKIAAKNILHEAPRRPIANTLRFSPIVGKLEEYFDKRLTPMPKNISAVPIISADGPKNSAAKNIAGAAARSEKANGIIASPRDANATAAPPGSILSAIAKIANEPANNNIGTDKNIMPTPSIIIAAIAIGAIGRSAANIIAKPATATPMTIKAPAA